MLLAANTGLLITQMEDIDAEHKKLKRFMRESVPILNARRLSRLSG